MKYKFSQSGLKDLEDPLNCPFRWKASHIDHTEEYKLGDAAQWGKFFEFLCLGTDTGCTEMPLLKSGGMSAIEKRVRLQAEVFKQFHDPESPLFIGEVVFKTDIFLETTNRKGILDYATENEAGDLTWWDLKLVADLYQGYYKYGNHTQANYDQQVFYDDLIRKNGFRKPPKMGLLIFESGTKARMKKIILDISDISLEVMNNRVEEAEKVIKLYDSKGWVKVPHLNECIKCSIEGCEQRAEQLPTETQPEGCEERAEQLLEDIAIEI
jgi:hypothetical protein